MRRVTLLACGLAVAGFGAAQPYAAGPQVATFFSDIDDTDQPYALYVPRHYDPAKKYPLVVSLHGADSNHRLNLRRVFGKGNLLGETDAEATRYFPPLRDVDFVVASPLARGTMGYQGIAEYEVYRMLADVQKRLSIDEDRVYLTGLSMGGGGALWLGLTRPDIWAAVAPVCPAAPEETRRLAGNALNVPMHLFQGAIDPLVAADSSRQWQRDLQALGCPVEYTEYPNVRHNAWDFAYRNGAVFDLFEPLRRNRYPQRARFTTDRYRYASAYWLQLDGITPGTLAGIDAQVTGKDGLSIRTSNVTGFSLNWKGQAFAPEIDGAKMRERSTSFVKIGNVWKPGRYVPPPGSKRAGSEGPIAEAVSSRHIYVYGSGGFPDTDESIRRREQAQAAADWSGPHSRPLLSFRVLQDRDVRDKDLESANAVLFGTKETNTLIARYAAQLPLALNPSAADYGLVFIYPAGGRYVLIDSGLPWWTGAAEAKRGGWNFVPEKLRVLESLGDFILFKGSLENVIAEGRFTPEWKLPADAARKMRETGAVAIR